MDQQSANGGDNESLVPRPWSLRFVAKAGDYYFLVFKNLILRILTIGIYHPWAAVEERRFLSHHTHLDHEPLIFLGTPMEIFRGFLKIGIWIVAYQIVAQFVPRYLSGTFLAAWFAVTNLLMYSLIPFWMWFGTRYRMSRTAWMGIRFGLVGSFKPFLKRYWLGVFLTVITLGIYYPFLRYHLYKMKVDAMRYGSEPFHYYGDAQEEFWIAFRTSILSFFTLGIYSFWGHARLRTYRMKHLRFAGLSFKNTVTGGEYLWFTVKATFFIIITLGFALPYVFLEHQRLLIHGTTLYGAVDLSAIRQQSDKIGAGADVAADVLDIGGGDFGI